MSKREKITAFGLMFLRDSPDLLVEEAELIRIRFAEEWAREPDETLAAVTAPTELSTIVSSIARHELHKYGWSDYSPEEMRHQDVKGVIWDRLVGADVHILKAETDEAYAELHHADEAAIALISRGYFNLRCFNSRLADKIISPAFSYDEALRLVRQDLSDVEAMLSWFVPPLLERGRMHQW